MKTIRFLPPSAAAAVIAGQQIKARHTAAAQNRFIESSAWLDRTTRSTPDAAAC
jgi:hypothetical protein